MMKQMMQMTEMMEMMEMMEKGWLQKAKKMR
jgi:hypothetical protein